MKLTDFIPIPTQKELNVFKDLTDSYPNCPICNSKFEYISEFSSYKLKCSNGNNHDFHCKLKYISRKHNDILYKKHIATFYIYVDGWSIYYSTNWPDLVHIDRYETLTPSSSIFQSLVFLDPKKIKFTKPFVAIDKWFNKESLHSILDKITILL